jgi:hypothetical protein
VPRGYRLRGRRRLGRIFQQQGLLLTSLGGSWTLKAAPEPTGAAVPSPYNDGVAGVACPVAVLCVAVGFHVGTKIFKHGLILTRTGLSAPLVHAGSWPGLG